MFAATHVLSAAPVVYATRKPLKQGHNSRLDARRSNAASGRFTSWMNKARHGRNNVASISGLDRNVLVADARTKVPGNLNDFITGYHGDVVGVYIDHFNGATKELSPA